ncbi:hypothetical protein METBIDRAFT_33330, partial [Metschnikowia bicuspidata var. bicuspidata NRRL YB-4993]
GSFSNTGDMYFGISGAPLVGTPFIVTSVTSWTNSGMMVFRRASGGSALLVIEQVLGGDGLSRITNDGSICLYNTFWLQTTSIDGSGCITVGSGAELDLQLAVGTLLFSVAETQTIYLESSDSVLSILGLSVSLIPDNTIKVAGFGNGNTIHLDILFLSYSYSSTTGILTLSLTFLLEVDIDIGTGYDESLFSTSSTLISRSISYSGPAPNSIPAVCSCVSSFPEVTTTAIASSSTFIASTDRSLGTITASSETSAPASSAAPASSEAPVSSEGPTSSAAPASSEDPVSSEGPTSSTTPAFSEAPASSAAPASSEAPAFSDTGSSFVGTTYTTTFVSTKSDGSVETDSGVVVVTTDSVGSATTASDLTRDVSEVGTGKPVDVSSTFITSRNSKVTDSCDGKSTCTWTSTDGAASASAGENSKTGVYSTLTTVTNGPSASDVTKLTVTLPSCIDCDTITTGGEPTSSITALVSSLSNSMSSITISASVNINHHGESVYCI